MKVLTPTLFAALFGTLRPHPWVTPEELEEDAYSLFLSRSELMGWSASATLADSSNLWDMNDAAFTFSTTDRPTRVAWFQVGVDEHRLPRASLPLHPLLACAGDALERVGRLDLEAVQILVPVPAVGGQTAVSSVPNWFNVGDPAQRVGVRITLDSGEDPIMAQVADELAEVVSELARAPFAVDPAVLGSTHVQLQPEVTDGFWLGDGRHPVSFDAIVPEWTLDSIAWMTNLFAESSRRIGVTTSVLINVGRR